MEIKQLRALQMIAATGSFGEAAAQLDLTQSALSHQIQRLEEELDETLLIRARPKVYPSPAGLIVLQSAKKILGELMTLETKFARSRSGPAKGVLRVAATTMSFVYLLGDICEQFIARYPGIELICTATETAEAAVKRVLTGAADVAFGPLLEESDQLSRLVVGRTEHAFIIRQGHPLSNQNTASLEELRCFPVVLFQANSGTRQITDQIFLSGQGYPKILAESNDVQFIKRIVSISNGSALIAVYALANEIKHKKLKLLRFADKPLLVDVGIVHKTTLRMNSLDLFKALCFELRGQNPLEMTIETAHHARPFEPLPSDKQETARPL
ncbi:LysR family transcriptional regulator [Eoetvoesiella caeni]